MTNPSSESPAQYRAKVFQWAASAGLKQVRLVIYQPRAAGTTEYVMPIGELEAFAVKLEARARAVAEADATRSTVPFEKWWPLHLNLKPDSGSCSWCRAMPECPSVQAELQASAEADFAAIEDDMPVVVEPTGHCAVKLSTAMKVAPLMEDWLKSVRAEVERRLLAGEDVPGFGLEVGRRGNREFKDAEEAERLLRKQFRLTVEEAYTLKLKSPTQLEKLTKPLGETGKPVLGPRQWALLEEQVVRNEGKPSVKPVFAIKNPWVPPAITTSEFSAIDDDYDLA